jgi:DNA polymerase-1
LLELSNSDSDNSVHTDYKQTGTTSGRLSSINPNMQNIPSQGDWAEKVRKIFVPRKGFKFIGIDYSQMELRIMADISEDKLLQQDFEQGHDIHTATAARILDKSIDDVTKAERSVGKTVNFAILFGQTPFGLSRLLNIDRQEATSYIRSYFEAYVGVEEYVRKLEKEAFKRGFVQSMLGMTRNVPALRSKNIRARYAAQREAINMPIQGTESDIMKLAMIEIQNIIDKEYENNAYILLQVHDELIFEAKEDIAKEFEEKVLEIMKNAVNLNVPLKLSSAIGSNLSEIK